jgi:uncharacterized protein (TIGR03435 family)
MRRKKVLLAAVVLMSILSTVAIYGQSQRASAPSFEVASIRLNKLNEKSERRMIVSPGRISYSRVSLMECIAAAYGLEYFQISGPDWLQSGGYRYDIAAKAEGSAGKDELMRMLQTLLVDRFKLAIHQDKKEMQVYELVTGRNGPKLRASETEAEDGFRPIEGGLVFHSSMLAFAGFLTGRLGRPVLDNTKLKGTFDFTLSLSASQGQKGIEETKRAMFQSDPSLWMDAIDSVGLKLESKKAPVDFLVVDHAEKVPSEN